MTAHAPWTALDPAHQAPHPARTVEHRRAGLRQGAEAALLSRLFGGDHTHAPRPTPRPGDIPHA
ncbi:hypothetical protein [Streptomyces sp. NPDC002082]|uniref:hypothetical protein n=1 Tax=Streptomyces sp. NPDC002082 TaxID=3154772 RepID=UPI003328143D